MGTAFSSSLFGLGGSLVLGFLDLQAAQAQNRFFNDLRTGWPDPPDYPQAHMLERASSRSRFMSRRCSSRQRKVWSRCKGPCREAKRRIATNTHLLALTEKLGELSDQMRAGQELMTSWRKARRITADPGAAGGRASRRRARRSNPCAHSRPRRLRGAPDRRNDFRAGRVVRQVRSDLKLLARTMAAIAEDSERPPQKTL